MSKIGRGTQYDGFLNAIIQIMCDLMFLSLKKFGKQEMPDCTDNQPQKIPGITNNLQIPSIHGDTILITKARQQKISLTE